MRPEIVFENVEQLQQPGGLEEISSLTTYYIIYYFNL